MADSKRKQIITAIDTRLKTILIAGGFKTNLGQKVYPWKQTAFSEDEIPGLTYRDPSNVREPEGPVSKFRWVLTIEVEIVAQTTAPTMRDYIADVLQAIGVDHTWGALAQRTGQPNAEIQTEQAEQIITGAKVTFPVTYDAPLWED